MSAVPIQAQIGVIGGSGLYQMDDLENIQKITLDTPFGPPSDDLVYGTLDGVGVVFLARHGQGHRLIPSQVPYQANIYAMKMCGVKYLLSVSAVGSLREQMAPRDMVLPDQFIDLTKQRTASYFGNGAVAHVSMAQPVCPELSKQLSASMDELPAEQAVTCHRGGTYVCIEGPQFSSLAESNWYRSMQADIIGMTNMPEAKLAMEAQIAYATLAMVTDYDCWHPREDNVSADLALKNLLHNAQLAPRIIARTIARIAREQPTCAAHTALQNALVTPLDNMPSSSREIVATLLG